MPKEDTQFRPGVSGNPGGRARLPEDIRKANQMNRVDFARTLNSFVNLTKDGLAEKLRNPNASMIELIVGHIVAKAAKDGDIQRANFLLDRMIGKVAEVHQLEGTAPITLNYKK